MSKQQLPLHPHIDHLKGQAKQLLRQFQAGNTEALNRIQVNYPKYQTRSLKAITSSKFGLQDAMLVVSREYGFTNWTVLKEHVESLKIKSISEDTSELIEAARKGDAASVEALLHEGADAKHACTYYGRGNDHYEYEPPLRDAIRGNHLDCVRLLLNNSAQTITGQWHALEEARRCQNLEMVELLSKQASQAQELLDAIRLEEPDRVGTLLAETPALASCFEQSHGEAPAPLFLAAKLGQSEVVHTLLEAGADPHATYSSSTFTALTAARYHQHQAIMNQLMELGADSPSLTSYLYAAYQGDLAQTKAFLDNGAVSINDKDACQWHVLFCTFQSSNQELIDWLVQHGADINQSLGWKDYLWFKHYIDSGNQKAFRQVLDLGFDLQSPKNHGPQLLEYARQKKRPEFEKLIQERL